MYQDSKNLFQQILAMFTSEPPSNPNDTFTYTVPKKEIDHINPHNHHHRLMETGFKSASITPA